MKLKLTEAVKVIPLAKLDKRLDTDSEIYPVDHNLDSMPPVPATFTEKPSPVPGKKEKVYAHESIDEDILREYTGPNTIDDDTEIDDDTDINIDDYLDNADFDTDEMKSKQVSDELPGTKYTIGHAKGAIDGALSKWMELVRDIPEGKRHNFMEIGERLTEISAVIDRDFIKGEHDEA